MRIVRMHILKNVIIKFNIRSIIHSLCKMIGLKFHIFTMVPSSSTSQMKCRLLAIFHCRDWVDIFRRLCGDARVSFHFFPELTYWSAKEVNSAILYVAVAAEVMDWIIP